MDDSIHIAMGADRNYLPLAAIAMASIAENTSRNVTFHFLHEDLTEKDFSALAFLKNYPKVKFKDHRITDAFFREYPAMRWSRSIYYRLIIPELFPELDRIIYLDCDLLVLDDLTKLAELDFADALALAVATKINPRHAEALGIAPDFYLNSGVLAFSPKRWREENLIQQFRQCMEQFSDQLKYPDQDILNVVLKGKIKFIHPKWNIITSTFRNEPVLCYSIDELIEAFRSPGIVHFTGRHKPWHPFKSFHHPFSLAMRRYAKIAGQKKIFRTLTLKSWIFPPIAPLKKRLPWDESAIDRKHLALNR